MNVFKLHSAFIGNVDYLLSCNYRHLSFHIDITKGYFELCQPDLPSQSQIIIVSVAIIWQIILLSYSNYF